MPMGDVRCVQCGAWNPMLPHFCAGGASAGGASPVEVKVGRYQFYPHQLTESDFRRIIREELERYRNSESESARTKS